MNDRNGNPLEVGARVVLCGVIVRTQDGPKDAVVELDVDSADGRRESVEVASAALDARDVVDPHERAAAAAPPAEAPASANAQEEKQAQAKTARATAHKAEESHKAAKHGKKH